MGKSAPSPPPAPDPTATANAQSAANIDTAIAQGLMNHTSQYTPYGSSVFTQTGTQSVNGKDVPTYRQDVTLTPDQQSALNSQNQLTNSLYGLANDQTGRIAQNTSQPFDMSGLPKLPTDVGQYDQKTIDAMYGQAKSRLDPQWQQDQTRLTTDLANRGIVEGSDAYTKAQDQFARAKNDAYGSAMNQAITAGGQKSAQDLGLLTGLRNQGIQEQSFLREQPLNEAVALMGGGQINNPQFSQLPQTGVAPTDVIGAYGLQNNANIAGYQGNVSATNAANQGFAGLLGSGAMAAAYW